MRTHSQPQSREERRQRRAASPPLPPSWEPSSGLRRRGSRGRGGRGGPSIPTAASREGFAPRPGAPLSAAPAPRGCVPGPPPHRGGSHLCPGAGAGGARRLRTPPPQRSASSPLRSAPLRAALPGSGAERGMLPGVCAPPSPHLPGTLRSIPVWGGGNCDAVPGGASPLRPGVAPNPRTVPARRGSAGPAAAAAPPLPTEPGTFVNNSQPRW